MSRSPHGSPRTAAWATPQKPRTTPRVVRVGRAANDNTRPPSLRAWLTAASLALAVAAVVWLMVG